MEDPAEFFANVFGGERFMDYIGEISLMKDMTSVANTMLSEEEKAAEAAAAESSNANASSSTTTSTEPHQAPPTAAPASGSRDGTAQPASVHMRHRCLPPRPPLPARRREHPPRSQHRRRRGTRRSARR